MSQTSVFDEVLDAVERLDLDAQAELIAIVGRRLIEEGRKKVLETVEQSLLEYDRGDCPVMTPEEIMREAMS